MYIEADLEAIGQRLKAIPQVTFTNCCFGACRQDFPAVADAATVDASMLYYDEEASVRTISTSSAEGMIDIIPDEEGDASSFQQMEVS